MTSAASKAQLPASATDDIKYVLSSFRPMDESIKPLVDAGLLPCATYVLPDGTPMVPFEHAQLLDEVAGDPAEIASLFADRFLAAGGVPELVSAEYEAWLTGEYGACLRVSSPEMIVAKGSLMSAIGALLAAPTPTDDLWCAALRGAVDALDAIERPFAVFDRERFGGPTSRDRLITATRERFRQAWA